MPSGLRKGLTSYGDPGFSLFLRKAFIKAKGFSDDALDRPIIGVTDTYSDFNPCHGNVPQLIEAVKRGVMLAGGLPMEFPTVSIHESFSHPTSMYLRTLMSIETVSGRLAPSVGTCMVMGTASTMACVVEALGFSLPYAAAVPAVHAERIRIAEASGRQAVAMAKAGSPRPRKLFTERALRNAL